MGIRNYIFPLQSSHKDSYFEMTQTTLDTIRQNLLLFFATDEKERVVNNHLGSRFRRWLFESDARAIRSKCEQEVVRIFEDFFPELDLKKVVVELIDDTQTTQGAIKIDITYSLKSVNNYGESISVVIG